MQINCVYRKGSTGKIMYDIHTEMQKQGIESVICYGRGEKTTDKNVYKTSSEIIAKFNNAKSRFTGMPYGGCFFATNNLLKIIKKEAPDVVHLHSINGFFVNIYRLINFLKKNKIPTVLTNHGDFMFSGSCSHAYECTKWQTHCKNCPQKNNARFLKMIDISEHLFYKMKNALSGFENLISVAVSEWLYNRTLKSPILDGFEKVTVLNGIDTEIFSILENTDIRKKHNINADSKIILHVTAAFNLEKGHLKGGYYLNELAKKLKDENVVVLVVGSATVPNKNMLADNIIPVGRVASQKELAKYYSAADLTVLASKTETFSMPCAESLCCATPVVGFKAGAPETVSIEKYSRFCEYGNLEALEKNVREFLYGFNFDRNIIAAEAKEKYSKERMAAEYISLYKKLYETGAVI